MHLALAEAFGTEPAPVAWAELLAGGLDDLDDRDSPGRRGPATSAWPSSTTPAPPSGCTATSTWVRSSATRTGGSSSTSRASPECRCTSGGSGPPRWLSPGCCGRSTTCSRRCWSAARRLEPELADLALAWEDRNRQRFLGAYLNEPGIDALLPVDDSALYTMLGAFELAKAVYEVGYERITGPNGP